MASKTGEFFKFLIMLQILFGLLITCTVHFLPADAKVFINPMAAKWTQDDATIQKNKMNDTFTNLKNQNPVLAGLGVAFQTGSFIVDMLINSVLALPEMASILIGGIFVFIPIDPYIGSVISIAVFAVCTMVYMLLLIGFLGGIRSGTVV
ncbi:MAG: hypothetical protein MUP17_04990 [candidate division Zixibacteria bacterium]|nr:hypothetical protein [candidate division Zixibacteria bacterium]